ncbi:MAG: CoA-binding protein [Candidatus Magnetoovum sp. WYHC-5]|nr:CoA-binding protein [Candidatus Magnetoovum sp. WYHC-5]
MFNGNYEGIFKKCKTIAVYGMSANSEKPSHRVPMFLMSKGYNIIPVNPNAQQIAGKESHSSLQTIEEDIDIVEVFRPSKEALDIVKMAVDRKRKRGDIKVIWLQSGIINDEAEKLATSAGIIFIQNRCMYTEYIKSCN